MAKTYSKIYNVFLHTAATQINVYGVRHCLEGVERNTNRQRQIKQGYTGVSNRVYTAYKKVGVLVKTKNGKVANNRKYKDCLCGLFITFVSKITDCSAIKVIKNGRENHYKRVKRHIPSIEEKQAKYK